MKKFLQRDERRVNVTKTILQTTVGSKGVYFVEKRDRKIL